MRRMSLLALIALLSLAGGCRKQAPTPEVADGSQGGQTPAPTGGQSSSDRPDVNSSKTEDPPRFAANSPFESASDRSESSRPKRLWADSFLWEKAPELIVGEWLSSKPETQGKYVLVECWATWCPPCRRSLAKLNAFHDKYRDSLVVIGISEEDPQVVQEFMADNPLAFYVAVDPEKRFKNALGVYGIPHAVIIEPEEGIVVWEGFPLLERYELSEAVIDHILSVGRQRGILPPGS